MGAGDAAPGVCGEVLHAVDDDRTPQRDHVRVHRDDPGPRWKAGGGQAVRPAPAALCAGAVGCDGALAYVPIGSDSLIGLRLLPPGLGLKGVVVGHAAQLLQGVVPDRLHVPELRPELSALLLVPRLPCPAYGVQPDVARDGQGQHPHRRLFPHIPLGAEGACAHQIFFCFHSFLLAIRLEPC